MNIVAGKYKGRKIKNLPSRKVRPTSSKVRESIFSIIKLSETATVFYEGKTFMLDLFAGSGIMGLEALSRGAANVVYVEKKPEALKVLKQNISIAECPEKVRIIAGDSLKKLEKFKEKEFNFIFVDPPYNNGLYEPVLEKIRNNNILKENGFIILEHNSKDKMCDIVERYDFKAYREKSYGDTGITILTLK